MGYLSGWKYRGSITLPSAGTGLPVVLKAANFDSDITSLSYGSGADLRFSSDSNGDVPLAFYLPYRQDPFDTVWVNVPSGISKIYYWVGNPNADYLPPGDTYGSDNVWSDAVGVYLFNMGRSASVVENGCENPIGSTIFEPSAYYYNGRTYIVYQGDTGLDPYITYFDHAAGTYATPVKIASNPLIEDSHGAPVLIVDDSGYIHVFFGAHHDPLKYSKSTSPEDISAWTAQTDIGSGLTYPHVRKLTDGTIVLVVRKLYSPTEPIDWRYVLYTSADSFASLTDIIADNGNIIYGSRLGYDQVNGRLWIAWVEYDYSVLERRNVYCAYYNLSDGHMYAYDGTDLGTEVGSTQRADCLVYNSGTNQTNTPYLVLNSNQNPNLLYSEESGTTYKHMFQYYTGTTWTTAEQITDAGNEFNLGVFYFVPNGIDAYLITATDGLRGGSLERWHRSNDGEWSKVRTIFDQTDAGVASFVADGAYQVKYIEGSGGADAKILFSLGDEGDWSNADIPIYVLDANDNYNHAAITNRSPANLLDVSTNTNHGTLNGSPSYNASGKVDACLVLDGDTQSVGLPSGLITDRTQYTLAGWAFISGDSPNEANDRQIILDMSADMYVFIQWCEADDSTNPNQFRVFSNDGSVTTNIYSSTLSTGNWYHIALVYDLSDDLTLYINGSPDGSASGVSAPTDLNTESRFGRDGTENDRNWLYGKLDSWMIFPTALSADEVDELYTNQNAPGTYPSDKSDLAEVGDSGILQVIMF